MGRYKLIFIIIFISLFLLINEYTRILPYYISFGINNIKIFKVLNRNPYIAYLIKEYK